jgi:hypothetical protein
VIFRVEENDIVFDPLTRKKIKPITCVKLRDHAFSTLDNRSLLVRTVFKRAVIKILIKI